VTAAELLGSFELLVADAAITSSPAKPYPGGAGTGIASTDENPAACKLIVDADYIGTTSGIFLQNR